MATHNLNKNRVTIALMLVGLAIAGIIYMQFIGLRDSYQISQQQTAIKVREIFNQGINDYKNDKAKELRVVVKNFINHDNNYFSQNRNYNGGIFVGYGDGHHAWYMWKVSPKELVEFKKDRKDFLLKKIDRLNLDELVDAYSPLVGAIEYADTTYLGYLATQAANKFNNIYTDTAAISRAIKKRFEKNNIAFKGSIHGYETSLANESVIRSKIEKRNQSGDSLLASRLIFTNDQGSLNEKLKGVVLSIKMPIPYMLRSITTTITGSLLLMLFIVFCIVYLLYLFMKQKKLSDIKNDFISNISHELKTPIATVQAAVQGMQHFDILNDKQKTQQYLNTAATELQRLSGMVNQILSVSMFESQQFVINPTIFNLREAIEQTIDSQTLLQQKQANITLVYTAPVEVTADKNYLTQAISNLIENAIKYSDANANLIINCHSVDKGIAIEVQDNGPGIPKVYQPYIFQKFFRVPGLSTQVRGHGLGLNFVQKIIEKHGGLVRLQQSDANGTTFYLFLPQ